MPRPAAPALELTPVERDAVRRWRARFRVEGVAGVGVIAKGRGRKPSLPPGTVEVSNDPRFEEKLVGVAGMYLNPPARAVVFSYDEKTQC